MNEEVPVPSPDKMGGLAAGKASSHKNRSQTNHEGAGEGLSAPATPTNGNEAAKEEEEEEEDEQYDKNMDKVKR